MKKLVLIFGVLLVSSLSALSNVTIISGLTEVNSGNPGEKISGEIVIVNTSGSSQLVKFEKYDALFSCSADRKFEASETHDLSSKEWINSPFTSMVIPAGEKFVLPFEVEIPNNPSISGTYWSVIMVSVDQPIASREIEDNIGVNSKIRYAVGIITHVLPPSNVELQFDKISLSNQETNQAIHVKLKNNGLYMEGIFMELEIYDQNGNFIRKIKTKRNMVFPGYCKDFKLELSDLVKGNYECVLIAGSRDVYIGTNISLTL